MDVEKNDDSFTMTRSMDKLDHVEIRYSFLWCMNLAHHVVDVLAIGGSSAVKHHINLMVKAQNIFAFPLIGV